MSIEIKCDLCGIPISMMETCNVFTMRNGVRFIEVEQNGLGSVPFDENFYVCDECLEKVYDACVRLKVVEQ